MLALVIVAVLAGALIVIRQRLESTSRTLATLAGALEVVEAEHLRPLEPAVKAINEQFDIDRRRVPGDRRQGQDRRRQEAVMTLEWIGDVILLLVVLPVVIYLLHGVLTAANSIVPSVRPDRRRRPARAPPTWTRCRCC